MHDCRDGAWADSMSKPITSTALMMLYVAAAAGATADAAVDIQSVSEPRVVWQSAQTPVAVPTVQSNSLSRSYYTLAMAPPTIPESGGSLLRVNGKPLWRFALLALESEKGRFGASTCGANGASQTTRGQTQTAKSKF